MTQTSDIQAHLRTQGDNVIGALVMWTLAGLEIGRDEFRAQMEDMDLGDAVGRDPRAITHARAAITSARTGRKDVLIRQITRDEHKVVWGIVDETRDASTVKVEHEQRSRIALFPATGELALEDPDGTVGQAVKAEYDRRRENVLTADVSKVVITAITGPMQGLRLAGRGGAYFVRAKHIPTLRRLASYLEAQGTDSLVTILEITGDGDNLNQAGKRAHLELSARVREVLHESRSFIEELRSKDSDAEVPEKVVETRMRRFREIRDAAHLYSDLLGDLRERIESELDAARSEVLGLTAGDEPEPTFDDDGTDEASEAMLAAQAASDAPEKDEDDLDSIDFG